jgi:ATP-dependent helicase/DNAse subunit B
LRGEFLLLGFRPAGFFHIIQFSRSFPYNSSWRIPPIRLPQHFDAERSLDKKTTFTVFTGIAGTGKTTALLDLYRTALRQAQSTALPGMTLWLSPTNRAQAEVRNRLLDDSLDVVFRPNLFTFDQFADEVLKTAPQAVAPCSPAMQRVLLRRVVTELARQKQLRHFRSIARTSGFLDLVSAFISELKRSETWPEHFATACAQRGGRAGDRELVLIYERYQQALLAANVYDGEGRFWSARTALADGHWGRFANLSLVVIDGFTDFTEAQFKILELLADQVGQMYLSLLTGAEVARRDLFAKTAAVLKRLQRLGTPEFRVFPRESGLQAAVKHSQSDGAGIAARALPPAIAHISRNLFVNPREVSRSSDADGVEVVAVAGSIGEVRYLAARVKQLLLEGVAPDDIVVAVRDLDEYAVLIEEIFSAAGLPFACEAGLPGSRLAPVKALFNLLSLEAEDWPFARLMALLDSNYFQPDWGEFDDRRAVRDVSAELRRNQLAEGRERIISAFERIAHQQSSETSDSVHVPAHRAWRLLARLSHATAELRREHDLAGWSGVIASLVREIGLDRVRLDDESPDSGRTFGSFLTSVLFDAARGEQIAGIASPRLTLADFLGEFTDLLEHQRLAPHRREEGRVRVLSAEQVRNLDVPRLFLAGLTETSFPRHRSDDCLYSERDRQELNDCGLSLGHRAVRAQEELLMFYGVVTRARRQLVMTYPVVTDEGQPLSRSPYLSSICELFDPTALVIDLQEQLDPIPKLERILSQSDCRVRGMADALAGRPALFRAACEEQRAARNCLAAVDMNARRFQTGGLTNYEGMLENPRNIERIQEHFSTEHEFSATQLEAYAECPFRFLIKHVLKLDPPTIPGVETDFARRGSLVHDLLAELHRSLFAEGNEAGESRSVPRGEEVATTFHRLLAANSQTRASAGSVHQALERIEQRLLVEWGEAYGRQWNDYVATLPRDAARPPLPALFEAAFGSAMPGAVRDENVSVTSPDSLTEKSADGTRSVPATLEAATFPPLIFGTAQSAVRVGGRIDRIDVGLAEGRAVFTVIDYKTGRRARATFDTVETGRTLQLALYALAVLRLEIAGPQAQPWQMGYWHLRETGFISDAKTKRTKSGEPLPAIDDAVWSALVQTLDEIIPRLAAGIRSGRFPVYNADPLCTSGCPYNTICRIAQVRSLPESLHKVPPK